MHRKSAFRPIERSRGQPFATVLAALGMPEIGPNATELLIAAGYHDIDKLLPTWLRNWCRDLREYTLVSEWHSLIDPKGSFDLINVSIHGIDEETVHDAPSYREALSISYYVMRSLYRIRILIVSRFLRRLNFERSRLCVFGWTGAGRRGGRRGTVRRPDVVRYRQFRAGFARATWRRPQSRRAGGRVTGGVTSRTGRLDWPRREAADIAANAGCIVTPNGRLPHFWCPRSSSWACSKANRRSSGYCREPDAIRPVTSPPVE